MKYKRIIILLLVFSIVLMTACTQDTEDKPAETSKSYKFISQIQKVDCYLCSGSEDNPIAEFREHANIGIINVNTFEVMELEINRYDGNGNQIMDATGAMHMCNRSLGEIQVTGMVDPDCSFASVNFDPDGKTIDEEKIGQFLCQDCLDDFATSCHGSESISPIAVVNFKHRYLAALNERTPWLMRKDYLVTVNYDEDGSIGVVAVYNPHRFQENDGIQR